jgi:alanyl-tRNA synthetase
MYYDACTGDASELEFRAVVTDIRLDSHAVAESGQKEQVWQVALDRTAFYPEGGGQPWDMGVLVATAKSGAVLEVPVERVEEDEAGEVWHFVRKPLPEGTEVVGRVDADRRMDHAQQHTGQHLLSAVFLRELGARTVSFHLSPLKTGAESVTIDLALKDGIEKLSEDELRRVEAAANRLIYEDRAVRLGWVSREEAEAMLARGELRKLPEFVDYRAGGPVRIVETIGVEFNACGGTHVGSTGAIGGLLVRRVEKVKQGWRVEFCCGLRAVRAAGADFARLGEAAAMLSAGLADVPGRVAALIEEGKVAAKERKALVEELARAEAVALVGAAAEGAVVTAVFAGKDVEFAKRVVAKVAGLGRAAVAGVTHGAEGAIAAARRPGSAVDAGEALRGVLSAAGARGGGSAEMAQGVCRAEQVEALVAQLSQALDG